jgi:ABC-2 type transport system permease protein
VLAQTRAELLLTLRRGESVLITVIVPALLLVFFASLGVAGDGGGGASRPVDFLLPGMLALAVIATGMVSLGIATAYERHYGVLKRLGASPLPRAGLLLAKALAILVLEVAQVAILLAIAAALYGWRPTGAPLVAGLALVLGTAAFAGLGLAMAGALRAEATLAGANGLYLVFLLLSGAVLPLDRLPSFVATAARLLPAAALTGALRAAFDAGAPFPALDLAILTAWAVAILVVAARTFRWE